MKAKSLFVTVLSLVLGTSLSAQITVNQDGGGRIGIPTYLIEADQWQAKTDFATGVSREQADSRYAAFCALRRMRSGFTGIQDSGRVSCKAR